MRWLAGRRHKGAALHASPVDLRSSISSKTPPWSDAWLCGASAPCSAEGTRNSSTIALLPAAQAASSSHAAVTIAVASLDTPSPAAPRPPTHLLAPGGWLGPR